MTFYSARSSDTAKSALELCAMSVIPSLFPYMVISALIVSTGAADGIAMLFGWIASPLKLPKSAASAMFLGAACGFPIGADATARLYSSGRITKDEASRLAAIANNTGPAFIIEVVGGVFWGSRGFGFAIYTFQLISAAICGLLFRMQSSRKGSTSESCLTNDTCRCISATEPFGIQLTRAVSGAGRSIITVCAFVVFFSVITEYISALLSVMNMPSFIYPAIAAILEFTEGCSVGGSIGGSFGAAVCGFAVGFSGLSVFAQSAVFLTGAGIPMKQMLMSKVLQGILTGVMSVLYLQFFPIEAVTGTVDALAIPSGSDALMICEFAVMAVLAILPLQRTNYKYKQKSRRL